MMDVKEEHHHPHKTHTAHTSKDQGQPHHIIATTPNNSCQNPETNISYSVKRPSLSNFPSSGQTASKLNNLFCIKKDTTFSIKTTTFIHSFIHQYLVR
jgi:hypothetical protein